MKPQVLMNMLRGDVARLRRCTQITTCDASDDAGGTPSPDHPTTRSTRWLVSADPYSSLLGSVTT